MMASGKSRLELYPLYALLGTVPSVRCRLQWHHDPSEHEDVFSTKIRSSAPE